MLKTNKNQGVAQKGFTIIEVLIVLAIAGLILLIVFLAVPALQRNSRNTAIKNDAQNVVGGISEFQNANNGQLPTTISGTGSITFSKANANNTNINVQGTTQVSSQNTNPASAAAPALGTVVVYLGYRCTQGASARAVAALYSIEVAGNNPVKQCLES